MARDYSALIPSANREQPKFSAMVQAVAGAFGGVFDVLQAIPPAFDIDTAEGVQLDVVGQWVGQSRLIGGVLLVQYFGFSDNPAALPYGDESNPAIGGRFADESDPIVGTSILADPEYRVVLKARIARNNSFGSTADIVAALEYMFNAPAVVDDPGTMAIGLYIGRQLTLTERAIITGLDILPRPAGVRIATRGYYNSDGYLGWDTQTGAVPFAEEGYTGPLGFLMEEF